MLKPSPAISHATLHCALAHDVCWRFLVQTYYKQSPPNLLYTPNVGAVHMEEKTSPEEISNSLNKCPYCACCFCTDADLKRHIDIYGTLKTEHASKFQKEHGRLEHGSFNGPE